MPKKTSQKKKPAPAIPISPTPWALEPVDLTINDANGVKVAVVCMPEPDGVKDFDARSDIAEANARILTDAPLMHAALLEIMRKAAQANDADDFERQQYGELCEEIVELVETTIGGPPKAGPQYFTVVGFTVEDCRWTDHFLAKNAAEAEEMAIKEHADFGIRVVAVFAGKLTCADTHDLISERRNSARK